jgi:predicted ester cyclase
METAEEHYRSRGVEGMQLTIRADNAPARALYDSLGYSPVERRVRMWKEFAPALPGGSTREAIRVVERWTDEVWNEGRLDLASELVADGCLRHDPGKAPARISLAENLERIASFRKQVPDLHFTNDDLVADGDRVVARFTMTGMDPDKGERFVFSGIEIFRLEGGKIAETWSSETAQGPWADSAGR